MSHERRLSCRYPILAERMPAILLVGRKELRAQILDESAGGFSVLAPADLELLTDVTVQLKTTSLSTEARVVYAVAEGDELRLGLKRIETPEAEPRAHWTNGWHATPFARPAWVGGVVLALLVGSAAWVIPRYEEDLGLRRPGKGRYEALSDRMFRTQSRSGGSAVEGALRSMERSGDAVQNWVRNQADDVRRTGERLVSPLDVRPPATPATADRDLDDPAAAEPASDEAAR